MGGNKARGIAQYAVLSWYAQKFEELLSQPGTKLMVIGYGFRDPHINEVLFQAVNHRGLRIFVIDPLGSDVARSLNPTNRATIRVGSELEQVFERSLIGASRRPLREIFGNDAVEHNKVQRLFDA
jgi:hypothetical protein